MTNFLIIISLLGSLYNSQIDELHFTPQQEPIFILFERSDLNKVEKSRSADESRYTEQYPLDYDRQYMIRNSNVSLTFQYEIENADMTFDSWQVDKSFLKSNDFKDQDWFLDTSKTEIQRLFSESNQVIYLVDKKKNKRGKATIIRVYYQGLL